MPPTGEADPPWTPTSWNGSAWSRAGSTSSWASPGSARPFISIAQRSTPAAGDGVRGRRWRSLVGTRWRVLSRHQVLRRARRIAETPPLVQVGSLLHVAERDGASRFGLLSQRRSLPDRPRHRCDRCGGHRHQPGRAAGWLVGLPSAVSLAAGEPSDAAGLHGSGAGVGRGLRPDPVVVGPGVVPHGRRHGGHHHGRQRLLRHHPLTTRHGKCHGSRTTARCPAGRGRRAPLTPQQLSDTPGPVHHGEQSLSHDLRARLQLGRAGGPIHRRRSSAAFLQQEEPGAALLVDPGSSGAGYARLGVRHGAVARRVNESGWSGHRGRRARCDHPAVHTMPRQPTELSRNCLRATGDCARDTGGDRSP